MSTSTPVWTLDSTHSLFEFTVRHMMIAKVKGRFTQFEVDFKGDPGDFANAQFSATLDVGSLDTHEKDRDAHLKSADFFDVENHPQITFVSRSITPVGGDEYDVDGDLTIRGVTKPIRLRVTHEGVGKDPWGGDRAAFSAQGSLSRKDFGLVWNVALESGGVLVGDEVKIAIETELVRQADAQQA